MIPVESIESRLAQVRESFDPDRFLEGDCHSLARALQIALGEGALCAAIRESVEEDGSVFMTTYSHMVLEIDGESFDIDGEGAADRWADQWESDEPDADGLVSEIKWVEVLPRDLPAFLAKWSARHDPDLIESLAGIMKGPRTTPRLRAA